MTYDLVHDEPLCILPRGAEQIAALLRNKYSILWWQGSPRTGATWTIEARRVSLAFVLMLSKARVVEPLSEDCPWLWIWRNGRGR